MRDGAWICLFAPLVGTVLILLGGRRISRRAAGWIATTSVFVAFAGAAVVVLRAARLERSRRHHVRRPGRGCRAAASRSASAFSSIRSAR